MYFVLATQTSNPTNWIIPSIETPENKWNYKLFSPINGRPYKWVTQGLISKSNSEGHPLPQVAHLAAQAALQSATSRGAGAQGQVQFFGRRTQMPLENDGKSKVTQLSTPPKCPRKYKAFFQEKLCFSRIPGKNPMVSWFPTLVFGIFYKALREFILVASQGAAIPPMVGNPPMHPHDGFRVKDEPTRWPQTTM